MPTDNFDYTGSLSSNWTVTSGGFAVNNDMVACSGSGGDTAFYNGTFSDDQSSTVTYGSFGGSDGVAPAVRLSAGGGYVCYTNGNFQLYGESELYVYEAAPIVGHSYTLTAKGSLITLTDDTAGTTLISVTDTSYTSGNPGINGYGNATGTQISSWAGTSLGAVAPPAPAPTCALLFF